MYGATPTENLLCQYENIKILAMAIPASEDGSSQFVTPVVHNQYGQFKLYNILLKTLFVDTTNEKEDSIEAYEINPSLLTGRIANKSLGKYSITFNHIHVLH